MSQPGSAARPNAIQKPLPGWFAGGVLGAVFGGGIAFLALHFYGYHLKLATPDASRPPAGASPPAMGPSTAGGGGGRGMGGGMGGGMGPGSLTGGGMGGGAEKRTLTSLIGKLDLLSQGVRVDLNAEQAAALRDKLTALDEAETLTGNDAKEQLEAIEGILTDEQKATLASIELPRGGRGGGGGADRGASGPRGPGGPAAPGSPAGPGGPPSGIGGPAGGANDNPFKSEANSQRLKDLLERLQSRGQQHRLE